MQIYLFNYKIYKFTKIKDTVDINFIQAFKSDGFSDIGRKELVWAKNGSGWRIIKENLDTPQKNYIIKMYRFLQKRSNDSDRFHVAINSY